MDFSQMGGAMMIGVVIGLIIAVLIGALVLFVINRIVNGFWPHYGRTIVVVIVAGIISGIINYLIGKALGVEHYYAMLVVGIIVNTLVGGSVMNWLVRRPDGSPLGFGRAALVFLVAAILGALLNLGVRNMLPGMGTGMQMKTP